MLKNVPYTVLINPIVKPLTKETEEDWEGCLSIPGMRGMVPRFSKIDYQGYDQYGNSINRNVDGFHARVVQHECDHLQGILYPMRITNFRTFGFYRSIVSGSKINGGSNQEIITQGFTTHQYHYCNQNYYRNLIEPAIINMSMLVPVQFEVGE